MAIPGNLYNFQKFSSRPPPQSQKHSYAPETKTKLTQKRNTKTDHCKRRLSKASKFFHIKPKQFSDLFPLYRSRKLTLDLNKIGTNYLITILITMALSIDQLSRNI